MCFMPQSSERTSPLIPCCKISGLEGKHLFLVSKLRPFIAENCSQFRVNFVQQNFIP